MKTSRRLILAPCLLSASLGSCAMLSAQESTATLKDSGELSYVNVGGNSPAQTLSLANDFSYRFAQGYHLGCRAKVLLGSNAGRDTAEHYQLQVNADKDLNPDSYVFTEESWEKNRFSGLDNVWNAGGGYGYKWLHSATQLLKNSGGFEYDYEERTTGDIKVFPIAFVGGRYTRRLAQNAELGQTAHYYRNLLDGRDARVSAETSLHVAINQHLALKVGYSVDYRNKPVKGFKDTDTLFSTALVVNF